jgi:hypothetical protein
MSRGSQRLTGILISIGALVNPRMNATHEGRRIVALREQMTDSCSTIRNKVSSCNCQH